MHEHGKGYLNMRPMWAHYETKMVQPSSIALDNWPLSRTPGDWTSLGKQDVMILQQALESGSLKWVKLTPEQLLKRTQRFESGRITRRLSELE